MGCEFCENAPTRYCDTEEFKKDITSGVNADLMYIERSVNSYYLTTGHRNDLFKINYCPLCGRKLEK